MFTKLTPNDESLAKLEWLVVASAARQVINFASCLGGFEGGLGWVKKYWVHLPDLMFTGWSPTLAKDVWFIVFVLIQ